MGTRGLLAALGVVTGLVMVGTVGWLVVSQRASSARFEALAAMRTRLQQDVLAVSTCPCEDVRGKLSAARADAALLGPHFDSELSQLELAVQKRLSVCVPQSLMAISDAIEQSKKQGGKALIAQIQKAKSEKETLLNGGSLHTSDEVKAAVAALDESIENAEKMAKRWAAQQEQEKQEREAEQRAAEEKAAAAAELQNSIRQMRLDSRKDHRKSLLQYAVILSLKELAHDYDRTQERLIIGDAQYKQTDSVVTPVEGHIVCRYQRVDIGEYEFVVVVAPQPGGGWQPIRYSAKWTGVRGREDPLNDFALTKAEQLLSAILSASPAL